MTDEKIKLKSILEEDVALGKLLLEFQARGSSQSMRGALDNFQEMAHALAASKGWWNEDVRKKPLECHALMVSEIAEAMEAWRNREPNAYIESGLKGVVYELGSPEFNESQGKPEGEFIELADAVLRILDYCGFHGVSLADCIIAKHEYNATRAQMHGGKRA